MNTDKNVKFQLGKVVATPGAFEALEKAGQNPSIFLNRHQSGDWGKMCSEDAHYNDEAIAYEGDPERQMRVMSVYRTTKGQAIWVITEWDRSVTTILLPSEY